MREDELCVIFDPEFLKDIEKLGNSVIISDYSIEDLRTVITNVDEILNPEFTYSYENDIPVVGFWDNDFKKFKTHIALPENLYSNEVTKDGETFEYDRISENINSGNSRVIRLFRFNYIRQCENKSEKSKTAFVVTGKINNNLTVSPIKCDQDKILITVEFPDTTKANINASTIEKDTKFLEGCGIPKGTNIFRTAYNFDSLGTKKSSTRYLDYTVSQVLVEKKDLPYIGQDGGAVFRRDNIRIYTKINIYCSNLMTNIRPKTRASLNINGGTIKIYGTLWYTEYESLGTELKYVGNGIEAIDGIPDSELILISHEGGLRDVRTNKFYILYGKYEGQSDPSVDVKAKISFWNPFTQKHETLESEILRLTQKTDVIPQWEVIYRSSQYIEPTGGDNIPVYVFPWEAGNIHTFTIRTTLPNINIERDFWMEYENPILQDLFEYSIEKIADRNYPITDYKVKLISKTPNLDTLKWLPIIDGKSDIKLATLWIKDYNYSESFYFVQSPKTSAIRLHDSNNQNINEIVLEYNQEIAEYYPVAVEAITKEEIGERDTWEILEYDPRLNFDSISGKLNPNNLDQLEYKLVLHAQESSETIEELNFGKIVVGRIRESETGNNFSDASEWRNIVSLYKIDIPIKKKGIIEKIISDDSIILREINLYKIKVVCNGPFACWMEYSDDYCFFNPQTNQPTYSNNYYSQSFNNQDGVYVWVALNNTTVLNKNPELVGQIFFTVCDREPEWPEDKSIPDNFKYSENLATCDIYRQMPQEIVLDYVDQKDRYVFLNSYEKTDIRFISTETPNIDELVLLNNTRINQQFESYYRPYSFNPITLLNNPTPVFTTTELYKYHIQSIQNPNELYDYYPISPCCIYKAHSYNYSDIVKEFYIFRKALGPSFYRSDNSVGNVIYVSANPNSTFDKERSLVIRSRYAIRDEEFVTNFDVSDGFEIKKITHTVLNTSDYKHQYSIILNTLVSNVGGQRSLGVLEITSRIYNLINFTSFDYNNIPYVELTQDDIDSIVPPTTMSISIIQEAGNGGNTGEIKVIGNRESKISNSGESRTFTINSSIPIEFPNISDEIGCTVNRISTSGFTLVVNSLVSGYEPIVPSITNSYVSYTLGRDIKFNLSINPTDPLIQSYYESFSFKQPGIKKGLIYASDRHTPLLYLGSNSIVEEVKSNTTSFNIFLGTFEINKQIQEGTEGNVREIEIETENTYNILSNTCYYYNTSWKNCIRFEFPENTTTKPVDRVFTVKYNDNGLLHKIVITVRQISGSGNIICDDNAYFLSHGECIETSDYTNNLGFFTFHTDLDIKTISLGIPKSLGEEYNFTYVGPSALGGSYKTYKAYIKLKPNLSNSVIKNQIFNFVKNGSEVIRSVFINQGFYCLTVCEPGSVNIGVYSGGTLGSENRPIVVPSRNNLTIGERKIFKLILKRSEPNPDTGLFEEEIVNINDIYFPEVLNYTWRFTSIYNPNLEEPGTDERNIQSGDSKSGNRGSSTEGDTEQEYNIPKTSTSEGDFLSTYSTSIFQSDNTVNSNFYPFLENTYTVYSTYYTSRIGIKVNISIAVQYPYDDPLYVFKKITTHSYTIYLSKQGETD